jgi:hypothetical protein
VEEKIFAQFSAVSAGDIVKLTEMYSTMDYCTNSASLLISHHVLCKFRLTFDFEIEGMDLCDKVTQLLKCGNENSPDLVAAVMNSLENQIRVTI